MLFDFDKARVECIDGKHHLCLAIKNIPMARQFVFSIKNRTYTAEVKEYRKKRSRDANSYFWHLAGAMADVLRTSKEEVYLEMLKRYGVHEVMKLPKDALPIILQAADYHEIFETTETHSVVRLIIGSSKYDSRQMAILIDGVISECKDLEIPTETPEELARLVREWGE
ncbi:MAG: hypothetical protein ACK5L3_00575 [Oscillospiraceae bacterium]